MLEVWRKIPGVVCYEASRLGRIRSLVRYQGGRVMKASLSHGYLVVSIGRRPRLVSQLVCLAFHGKPPLGKPCALHGNGNRLNNRPWNLRWGSRKDNADDTLKHGTRLYGEAKPSAKLTVVQALAIKARLKKGEKVGRLAQEFEVSPMTVSDIKRGVTWKEAQ